LIKEGSNRQFTIRESARRQSLVDLFCEKMAKGMAISKIAEMILFVDEKVASSSSYIKTVISSPRQL
jgi:hypothetical protein